jgi:phosphoribosyl-AMP cyclohydrolase
MTESRETGPILQPKYDANGLITAVVTDADSHELLMVAHMNADALAATIATNEATFWSRSRGELWRKGVTSGNVMRVREMRIDCDQDALWLMVEPAGPACHTGARSCFYRRVAGDGLEPVA